LHPVGEKLHDLVKAIEIRYKNQHNIAEKRQDAAV
jgi:hypothetical protein